MKKILIAMIVSMVMSFSVGAMANDGGDLYKTFCTACHGLDAKSPISPEFPVLAGKDEVYLYTQMKDIQNGIRTGNATMMMGILPALNDDQKKAVANWISKQ